MAWGAGGWAGANGWDIARGAIGDFAIAPAANRRIPHIESGVGQWLVDALGIYDDAVFGSIAHELNHVIGWDDPHDLSLSSAPNQYEPEVPALDRGSPVVSAITSIRRSTSPRPPRIQRSLARPP